MTGTIGSATRLLICSYFVSHSSGISFAQSFFSWEIFSSSSVSDFVEDRVSSISFSNVSIFSCNFSTSVDSVFCARSRLCHALTSASSCSAICCRTELSSFSMAKYSFWFLTLSIAVRLSFSLLRRSWALSSCRSTCFFASTTSLLIWSIFAQNSGMTFLSSSMVSSILLI